MAGYYRIRHAPAGDRILVGLSGGKDSMLLTAMLAEIKKYSPIPFDLACYTVNGMFAPNFPKAELEPSAHSSALHTTATMLT